LVFHRCGNGVVGKTDGQDFAGKKRTTKNDIPPKKAKLTKKTEKLEHFFVVLFFVGVWV